MRHILSATALFTLMAAGPAWAADLPARSAPPVYVPPPAAILWDGFYVGLNAGGTFGAGGTSVTPSPVSNGVIAGAPVVQTAIGQAGTAAGGSPLKTGFIGGGQVGYNKQLSPSFVAGLEADIQGLAGVNGVRTFSRTAPIAGFPANSETVTSSLSNKLDYLGTVRGRIGFLVAPTWLLYGTGGFAYGGVKSSFQTSETINGPNGVFPNPGATGATASRTRVGFTVGGGAEWKLSQNWSLKAEYLYYDLGTTTNSATLRLDSVAVSPFVIETVTTRSRIDGHIARVGLNYTFTTPVAPVVARY